MDDKNKNPLELPDNNPESSTQPIRSKKNATQKSEKNKQAIKIAYALAILLAFGGALVTKIVTERNLGNLKVPIEQEYITTIPATKKPTEPDSQVRLNMTNVPDTREEADTTTTETTKVAETKTEDIYAVPYKDYYTLPISTDILKEYKPDTPSYNATTDDWRTHPGVDFKGTEGSQVKSISAGTVTDIYDDILLGTVLVIDHGNQVTAKYCGLNKETLEIEAGDSVQEGQCIGYLGQVPFEKDELPHLHFEIYYKDKNVDPLELMGK